MSESSINSFLTPQTGQNSIGMRNLAVCGAAIHTLRKYKTSSIKLQQLVELIKQLVSGTDEETIKNVLYDLSPVISIRGDMAYPILEIFTEPNQGRSYYDTRQSTSQMAKRAIAMHIHNKLLNKLDAVLLDAGSACEAIALEMAEGNKGHFTIITNNMRAVKAFKRNSTIRIHVTGGFYFPDDEALIGARAMRALDDFFVRCAIVGVSGITTRHVFCHGIEGEEGLKKKFWSMSADILVIPLTLGKFAGRDACCFGELFKEMTKKKSVSDDSIRLDGIALQRVEARRKKERESLLEKDGHTFEHVDAPRFNADRCEIIIEPEWMIEKVYKDNKSLRDFLMERVDIINQNSNVSKVKVIHSSIAETDLL